MRKITDAENTVLSELHGQLVARHRRNILRTRYAEGEKRLDAMGMAIPPGMEAMQVAVGWPAKVLKTFTSRMRPEFFTMRAQSTLLDDLEAVFEDNSMELVEQMAIASACRHGVSFVFTSLGDVSQGEPEVLVTVRSARTASAIVDPRSRRTVAALELLGGSRVNLYLPGVVLECVRRPGGWWVDREYPTGSNRVLCTPYVHDATTEKPLGQSLITNGVMGYTDSGVRTLLRQEVSAEFYSAPRMALLGGDSSIFKDEHGNWIPGWELLIGAVWGLPDVSPDDDPDMPESLRRAELKQFSQMSMQPFSDQLRTIAAQLSGETSIPLQYLGVVQDSNPTSAAAIEASELDLVNAVHYQHPSFNMGRRGLAVDILTAIHGDLPGDAVADLRTLRSRWAPARTVSVSEQSQFVNLQVAAGNFQPGTEETLRLLPISEDEVQAHVAANRQGSFRSLSDRLAQAAQEAQQDSVVREMAGSRGSSDE